MFSISVKSNSGETLKNNLKLNYKMMTDLTATVFIFVGIISLNFEGIKGQGLPAGIKMDVDQIKTFLQNEITGPQDCTFYSISFKILSKNANISTGREIHIFLQPFSRRTCHESINRCMEP